MALAFCNTSSVLEFIEMFLMHFNIITHRLGVKFCNELNMPNSTKVTISVNA